MDIGRDYNRPAAVALIRGQTRLNSLEILRKLAIPRGKVLAHQDGMKLTPFALTAALLTTGLVSAPAFAQERDNHRREAAREAQQGRAAQPAPEAQQGRAAQPAREAQQGRAAQPAPARSAEQSRPRREEAPRVQAPVAAPPAGPRSCPRSPGYGSRPPPAAATAGPTRSGGRCAWIRLPFPPPRRSRFDRPGIVHR